ncbi:YciI family protein [Hyphomonas sp. FCG-A18]|uniref:YciI family protein n=1 Tax=Hyphomonas sp. FCG-A18 TaxID=3080019 RepID=UPI002B2A3F72|nr:YciI family protein [Hyphomonas sp. FCG-A18]
MTDFPATPPFVPRLEQTCYLVICRDGPGSAEPRKIHLKGHLDHVEANWTRYVTAGPIREPGGEALVGSIFLVLADTLEDAKALMNGDPYITCGMYETITYNEFSNSIGQYIGGKIWESAEAIAHRAAGGPSDDLSKGVKAS